MEKFFYRDTKDFAIFATLAILQTRYPHLNENSTPEEFEACGIIVIPYNDQQ